MGADVDGTSEDGAAPKPPGRLVAGIALGCGILVGFGILRAVFDFGPSTRHLEVLVGILAPLAGGAVAGLPPGNTRYRRAVTGALVGGILAALVGVIGFVGVVALGPPGAPIDITIASPIGYSILAAFIAISLVPPFATFGAIGAVLGGVGLRS